MNLRKAIELQLPQGFLIQEQLATGGTSWVYLASRPGGHERLIVKVMHPGMMKPDRVERFLREIRILKKLDHPRIVPVLDSGEADGVVYFTMPYIAGETLETRLRRGGDPFSVRETLLVARDVADALDHAHARGVVHRDVKPGNILLAGETAYLMDFGYAKASSLMSADDAAKESRFSIGTPDYMSPEQVKSKWGADWRTDFFSLGCVMYEMLAGRLPFPAASRRAAMETRLETSAPDVRALRPDVPADVAAIVRRNLESSPSERFATASALRSAVDEALRRLAAG